MFLSRTFLSYFTAFFFGAYNDNMFRNALVVMITYQSFLPPEKAAFFSFLAMALMMFPFFPFSAAAGETADKFSQKKVFQIVKGAEVILMLLTFIAFMQKSLTLLMILLFFMGTQSAFFSPLKYSYMPRNLKKEDLLKGNAYVNAGTYAAILMGTLMGNTLIDMENGRFITGLVLFLLAIAGFAGTFFIPSKTPSAPETKVDWNVFRSTYHLLQHILKEKRIAKCIAGLSVFWMTGALYVSQLAGFCKYVLGTQAKLIPLLYAIFSVGVALGSLLCGITGKKKNVMRLVFPALLFMALFTVDLYFVSRNWKRPEKTELYTIIQLCSMPEFYRIMADLLLLAVCGGFYSVPLNTFLQKNTDPAETARIISGNNILNSAAIALGTIIVSLLMGMKWISTEGVFLVVAFVNTATAFFLRSFLAKEKV